MNFYQSVSSFGFQYNKDPFFSRWTAISISGIPAASLLAENAHPANCFLVSPFCLFSKTGITGRYI